MRKFCFILLIVASFFIGTLFTKYYICNNDAYSNYINSLTKLKDELCVDTYINLSDFHFLVDNIVSANKAIKKEVSFSELENMDFSDFAQNAIPECVRKNNGKLYVIVKLSEGGYGVFMEDISPCFPTIFVKRNVADFAEHIRVNETTFSEIKKMDEYYMISPSGVFGTEHRIKPGFVIIISYTCDKQREEYIVNNITETRDVLYENLLSKDKELISAFCEE